jgi:hypothetical protein
MTAFTYLVPIRAEQEAVGLTAYLRELAGWCEVLVVDGSPPPVFAAHRAAWGAFARHLRPDPALACPNGKVQGVRTGMRAAGTERVVIADDDVRYGPATLARLVDLLDGADLVIPQNYFDPLPWHAAWDTARSLLNRAAGTDFPGTLAVRRDAFERYGCYRGDVLFENLELIRTVRARGGTVRAAPDLYVQRLPPTSGHFRRQRVRQAYDSQAQPARLAAELALLPAALLSRRARIALPLASVAAAEVGRRRHGGRAAFPARTSLFAPLWLAERAVCAWLALGRRCRGGIRYAGHVLRDAASPARALRATVPAGRTAAARPEADLRVAAVAERLER